MATRWMDFVEALSPCVCREDAAGVLLRALMDGLGDAAHRPGWETRVKRLGGAVFLHDGEGFRAALRWAPPPDASPALDLPASSSVWGALQARGEPVVLDVPGRELRWSSGERHILPPERQQGGTLTRLRTFQVTHLLAIPLHGAGGALQGMACLELAAPGARPDDLAVEEDVCRALQALCTLATPTLQLLPANPTRAPSSPHGPAMRALLDLALSLVDEPGCLLLVGAAGTGRSWLARWIHERSRRAPSPMASLEVRGLLGSQLEEALASDSGTLLLRDVEALTPSLALVLLRWFQRGSPGPRLIATTRLGVKELLGAIDARLAPSLAAWPLVLPCLSARKEEIGTLAGALLHASLGADAPPVRLTEPAIHTLEQAPWPGNLHDLRRVVLLAWRYACATATGGSAPPEQLGIEPITHALRHLHAAGLPVLEQLRTGARLLVERARSTPGLTLPLLEGYSGVVLAEALAMGMSAAEAADLFGLADARPAGNHWKALRNARDKAEAWCVWLEEPPPAALRTLAPRWGKNRR